MFAGRLVGPGVANSAGVTKEDEGVEKKIPLDPGNSEREFTPLIPFSNCNFCDWPTNRFGSGRTPPPNERKFSPEKVSKLVGGCGVACCGAGGGGLLVVLLVVLLVPGRMVPKVLGPTAAGLGGAALPVTTTGRTEFWTNGRTEFWGKNVWELEEVGPDGKKVLGVVLLVVVLLVVLLVVVVGG